MKLIYGLAYSFIAFFKNNIKNAIYFENFVDGI